MKFCLLFLLCQMDWYFFNITLSKINHIKLWSESQKFNLWCLRQFGPSFAQLDLEVWILLQLIQRLLPTEVQTAKQQQLPLQVESKNQRWSNCSENLQLFVSGLVAYLKSEMNKILNSGRKLSENVPWRESLDQEPHPICRWRLWTQKQVRLWMEKK